MKRIDVLDKGAVPNGGILRSNEFSSMSASDDIIRNTQTWAAARRREIEQKLEKEREDAIAAGYREGLQGFIEARYAYVQATSKLGDKLSFLLRKSLHRMFDAWMPEEILKATLAPVLSQLERQADVSIQVHPKSGGVLRDFLSEQVKDMNAFKIVENLGLDEGECVIFTQSEIIDMSRTVLIDQLMTAMSEYIDIAAAAHQEEFGAQDPSSST